MGLAYSDDLRRKRLEERDAEANLKRRKEFLEKIRATPPENLIYLDESGAPRR